MNTEKYMNDDEILENLQAIEEGRPEAKAQRLDDKYFYNLIPEDKLHEFFEPGAGIIPCEIESDSSIDIASLPNHVDLRKWDSPVDNQGREGRCTADATINCLMLKLGKVTGKKYDLSEWFHWQNYFKYNSVIAANTLCKHWQGEERFWPDHAKQGLAGWEDSQIATLSAPREIYSLVEIQKQLARGEPVLFSCGLDASLWSNAVVLGNRGTQKSGHATCALGYKVFQPGEKGYEEWKPHGGGYVIIKNSWGVHHGDKGYNMISFSYFLTGRFYTHALAFSDEINWKPGKEPGKVTPSEAALHVRVYPKYRYTPENYREHGAYGMTIRGADAGKVKSVEYVLDESLPQQTDGLDFGKTFGTYAKSGWQAGTAQVTLNDGKTVQLAIKIP